LILNSKICEHLRVFDPSAAAAAAAARDRRCFFVAGKGLGGYNESNSALRQPVGRRVLRIIPSGSEMGVPIHADYFYPGADVKISS
jgi:hypothetical protein